MVGLLFSCCKIHVMARNVLCSRNETGGSLSRRPLLVSSDNPLKILGHSSGRFWDKHTFMKPSDFFVLWNKPSEFSILRKSFWETSLQNSFVLRNKQWHETTLGASPQENRTSGQPSGPGVASGPFHGDEAEWHDTQNGSTKHNNTWQYTRRASNDTALPATWHITQYM